jgi:hypothetical protein
MRTIDREHGLIRKKADRGSGKPMRFVIPRELKAPE